MAVLVGLRCKDGFVICADRQVTSPGSFRYEEEKISITSSQGESLVFAYSGLPCLAREARDRIISKCSKMDAGAVYEAADAVLTEMARFHSDLKLQLLIGITKSKARSTLLKFDGKSLQLADDFNFLGVRDSALFRFLADILYSTEMNVTQGSALASYLASKAERYIDGCGGPIDLTILMHKQSDCAMLSQEEIRSRIQEMEEQESLFTDLIVQDHFSFCPPSHNRAPCRFATLFWRHCRGSGIEIDSSFVSSSSGLLIVPKSTGWCCASHSSSFAGKSPIQVTPGGLRG